MTDVTASGGLPANHGVERAAARIARTHHQHKTWMELQLGTQHQFRGLVGQVLRDLAPPPSELNALPLLWYSPSWGVLQAERYTWNRQRLVTPLIQPELQIELPEDAVPMTPIQPCKPGKSIDDIRRHTDPRNEPRAVA